MTALETKLAEFDEACKSDSYDGQSLIQMDLEECLAMLRKCVFQRDKLIWKYEPGEGNQRRLVEVKNAELLRAAEGV